MMRVTFDKLDVPLEKVVLALDVDEVPPDLRQLLVHVDSRPSSEGLLPPDLVSPGGVAGEGPPLAGLVPPGDEAVDVLGDVPGEAVLADVVWADGEGPVVGVRDD